ncbi:MAG TPA: hypothetical protein VHP56_11790 [Solirubrobacterales bacterium]|jgi:hypothetical protein|nr:hypothetical protein [Solirubrobacterales bacterium]
MNKKLMLLVAGALAALAFTALPGAASAKETKLKCEGAGACTYTVSGSVSEFSLLKGDTVKCESVTGTGTVTGLNAERESTTSTVELLFHSCKEQITPFHFACSSAAQPSGTVTTNPLVAHTIALPGSTSEAGVLLTGTSVTFTCAGGFASTQVTGSAIGEIESKCNTNTGLTQKLNFTATAHGTQTFRTYTGASADLEGKTSHTGGGSYETAAQTGKGTLTFNQNVILTCA